MNAHIRPRARTFGPESRRGPDSRNSTGIATKTGPWRGIGLRSDAKRVAPGRVFVAHDPRSASPSSLLLSIRAGYTVGPAPTYVRMFFPEGDHIRYTRRLTTFASERRCRKFCDRSNVRTPARSCAGIESFVSRLPLCRRSRIFTCDRAALRYAPVEVGGFPGRLQRHPWRDHPPSVQGRPLAMLSTDDAQQLRSSGRERPAATRPRPPHTASL